MKKMAVGECISSFVVDSVQAIPDFNATGYALHHARTGMEVYYVDIADPESCFCYSFQTPPFDDSGVFHIIEHTVLSGSKRYPVRDPFIQVDKASCNSFMNAMTFPDRTVYPAASPNRKDIDNIFAVYTDAVFQPLLREESFMQEGIRLTSVDGKVGFDGVVFHEMQGSFADSENIVASGLARSLYTSGAYTHESGGDPKAICRLTYQEYLATYKRYYHPSNARLFLYGDIGLEEKLQFLDTEYLDLDEGERFSPVSFEKRWSEEKKVFLPGPMSDEGKKGTVLLSWLTDSSLDTFAVTSLSVLVDILLGSPSSPLYAAILASGLGEDLSSESGQQTDFVQMPFAVGFSGIEEKDSEKAKDFLLHTIADIAQKGLSPALVEASMRRQEFLQCEKAGGLPQGIQLFLRAIKGWEHGMDIAGFWNRSDAMLRVRAALTENPRFFESLMQRLLIDNPHRVFLGVFPDSEYTTRENEALELCAKERKDDYSPASEARFEAFEHSTDCKEALMTIPQLHVSDLPREITYTPQSVKGQLICQEMETGGILYADIAFHAEGFSEEDLSCLYILSRLLPMAGTRSSAPEEVQTGLKMVTGGLGYYIETGKIARDGVARFFQIRMKCLGGTAKDAYEALSHFLQEVAIDDPKLVKAAFSDVISDFRESVISSGSSYAASASAEALSPSLALGERVMGLKGWKALATLHHRLSYEHIGTHLAALARKLFCSSLATVHISAEPSFMKTAEILSEEFLDSLEKGEVLPEQPISFTPSEVRVAYPIHSQVAFNALSMPSSSWISRELVAENLLAIVLGSSTLWEAIRSRGGAYGASMQVDLMEESIQLSSYRDPRCKGTFDDFAKALEDVSISPEELDHAILQAVGFSLRPVRPETNAMIGFRRYLYAITDEDRLLRRSFELSMTSSELEMAAKRLRERLVHSSGCATLASVALLDKDGLDWKKVKLPS